jgi:hypothetical protein
MYKKLLTIAILFYGSCVFGSHEYIINDDECPLQLTQYRFEIIKKPNSRLDEINAFVDYKNTGDKKIVAIKLYFNYFTPFIELINIIEGDDTIKLKPGKTDQSSWTDDVLKDHQYSEEGVTTVNVAKVKFEDGTFWKRNEDKTLKKIGDLLDKLEGK